MIHDVILKIVFALIVIVLVPWCISDSMASKNRVK